MSSSDSESPGPSSNLAARLCRREAWERWEDWSECKELYRTCGSFVEKTLDFRRDYVWYPEMRVRKQRKGKLKKRKSAGG